MQEKKGSKNSKIKKVSIVGVIPSFAFQRAKYCALELHRKLPQRFPLPEIVGLLELDWNEKLLEWRRTLGREYWCLRRPVAVFFDGRFIGSDIELIKLTTIGNILMEHIPRKNSIFLKENFRRDYISYLKKTKRIYCYLDICVDDVYVGTLNFELYSDIVPKTCENFKTLCLGTRGALLSYKGSRIHRIVKEGWLQGGDIQFKTGGGGFSIFCDPLEDECFGISHDRRGVLSMANDGRHSNGSQFFITLKPSKWMDTRYVAFGQVLEGVNVLDTLEKLETMYECPLKKIEIKNCGKLDIGDVEDVDAKYKEEPMPKKKPKVIETISDQIIRLIMEALTKALARKEYAPDILDDGDVPSKMNLQLYFQGFYSIPEQILEDSAQYLRKFRRQMIRGLKPSATEVVEVLMYDLLMAVLTRMTTLDDVKETIGHDLYQKMVGGIDMNLELCQKPYVKRLVDQIVTTAESMVNLITKKLLKMKRTSVNLKKFQEKMQNWAQSFVIQETFQGDNYHITDRPSWNKDFGKKKNEEIREEKQYPKRQGIPCCEKERKKKLDLEEKKLKSKYTSADICCLGSKIFQVSEVTLRDYFSDCRYGLKKTPEVEGDERMPLMDLIEIGRFTLKWMRRQETRVRSPERLCVEKKIRKWMEEVVYTPETSWIRNIVFGKDDVVFDHVDEIMYGAMTAGLLEMYYFVETYLKLCGGKKMKLVTRTIYPESTLAGTQSTGYGADEKAGDQDSTRALSGGSIGSTDGYSGTDGAQVGSKRLISETAGQRGNEGKSGELVKPPCICGHPCCVCQFDPKYRSGVLGSDGVDGRLTSSTERGRGGPGRGGDGRGRDGEYYGEGGEGDERGGRDEGQGDRTGERPEEVGKPCPSDMTLVDLNAIMAEKISMAPEEIDIKSFKWLKPYILEKGCDLKTEFATQVHKWLEGDRFNSSAFLSKHSLFTRASLLSLSISLAELIKDDNEMKAEVKNFVYDLWDLYFQEMYKEALLEYPPEVESDKGSEKEREGKAGVGGMGEPGIGDETEEKGGASKDGTSKDGKKQLGKYGVDGMGKDSKLGTVDPCEQLLAETPDFDFTTLCAEYLAEKNKRKAEGEPEGSEEEYTGGESYQKMSESNQKREKRSLEPGKTPRKEIKEKKQRTTSEPELMHKESEPEEWKEAGPEEEAKPEKSKSKEPEVQKSKSKEPEVQKSKSKEPEVQKSKSEEIEPEKPHESPEPSNVSPVDYDYAEESPEKMDESMEKEEYYSTHMEEDKEGSADYTDRRYIEEEKDKQNEPLVVQELVEVSSGEEVRVMPPYVLPFWVKFLTELTKQALGAIAKVSRLPRRLYFTTDSQMLFDDKMKEWFEFNAFNPQPTKGREIMDYISLHHRNLTNLEETARSYLKKKKFTELINRCSRITSADDVAEEIVTDVIDTAMKQTQDAGTYELFVSSLVSSAVASTPSRSEASFEEDEISFETDQKSSVEAESLQDD